MFLSQFSNKKGWIDNILLHALMMVRYQIRETKLLNVAILLNRRSHREKLYQSRLGGGEAWTGGI